MACRTSLIPSLAWQEWPILVPEGHAIIAQRLNVGITMQRGSSPGGTAEMTASAQSSLRDLLYLRSFPSCNLFMRNKRGVALRLPPPYALGRTRYAIPKPY